METARQRPEALPVEFFPNERISGLKSEVQSATAGICAERALIWTEYFKDGNNRDKHIYIQLAEALREVLLKKTVSIYPGELIVGNYSSKRVGGSVHPELSGIMPIMEIFSISKRATNPLEVSGADAIKLFSILPFWFRHGLLAKVYKSSRLKQAAFFLSQFKGYTYLINELGGISHIAPDYEKLMAVGTQGLIKEADEYQQECDCGSDPWYFYEAIKIMAEGLARFGERYAEQAQIMAAQEDDPDRKQELTRIARVCRSVPRKGASSFREALQSLVFGQIAIILESLDNSVCPGRMDQYLYPFYKKDFDSGVLSREEAKELLACFTIKTNELAPVFSKFVTRFYGGLTNFQSVIVGGLDRDGNDGTNELSYIFLELMDELRMKQPNYQARIHTGAPEDYIDKIYEVLSRGSSSPALYNDDVIVQTMVDHGYEIEDARDYAAIGCVEPAAQGKSFSSTDAAVFNAPMALEMALNQGRRFGSPWRTGKKTRPPDSMRSMDDVKEAFETQLTHHIKNLIADLQEAERLNAQYHPTPMTSMLLQGCMEAGTCSTRGGAAYNFSGIQCVGPADTGDALYAVDRLVFVEKRMSLGELVRLMKKNINDMRWLSIMRHLGKFGNDDPQADAWTRYVVDQFEKIIAGQGKNTRGGDYVAGLYSVTTHKGFGSATGALPHGRLKSEAFASGIAPVNGMDRKGPTALINSMNGLDFKKMANGINFNIKFDAAMLGRRSGMQAVKSLMSVYFKRGGMQAQINVIDPALLEDARQNPERYPNLLVRVSGYSAYFNDLSPAMKDDIIKRTSISLK